MTKLTDLPRTWDLTSYFPTFDGPEYREFKSKLFQDLEDSLTNAAALSDLTTDTLSAWAEHTTALEDLISRIAHLSSYLNNLASADTANEDYKSENAELARHFSTLTKFHNQLVRAFGSASQADWKTFLASPALEGATHSLERMRSEAKHRMSGPEESLAADLGINGIGAWGRLYVNLTGQMDFEMIWPDGRKERIPMAQRRALMANTDRAVRESAFREGNRAWEAHGQTFAAALNAIAGTRHTLYTGRDQPHFLDQPYFDSAVTSATVDAMFSAILSNLEIPRQALRAKAQLQQTDAVGFYDLEAPSPLDPVPPLLWSDAVDLVDQAFASGYPALSEYYRDILQKGWIESEKRADKGSGAYCTGSMVTGEQRVFMTYADTMHDANTLAHEVGHAWHSHVIKDLRPIAQDYPMTLAETASTFAEKLFMHGMLQDPELTTEQRVFLLDQECGNASSYLLNIAMRYEFEKEFYNLRKNKELSVSEINALMVSTQRKIYGNTITEGDEDPWFWASKLHFFITEVSFYNFPYTFGYLLSQALFAEFKESGPDFLPSYEAFLRATGVASCEDAVRDTLGWDLTSEAFWSKAVRAAEGPINSFSDLVAKRK